MGKVNFKNFVLYEDAAVCIINKPPGFASLMDRHEHLSLQLLAHEYDENLRAAHRLDKGTSGVLLYAKTPEMYRNLAIQFENREISKHYHAIADGVHNFSEDAISKSIEVLTTGRSKISPQGKEALTYVTTLKAFRYHTLVQCKPVTGRLHQIRVHLASVGAPLAGDDLYGGQPFLLSRLKRRYNLKKFEEEIPVIQRFALHAHSITFKDMDGYQQHWNAPYPKDFAAAIRQLEKNC